MRGLPADNSPDKHETVTLEKLAAIRSGDDIKTVQGNLGHATASFTLDVYGHVTDQMKQTSAERMESYINAVLNL